MEQPLAAQVLTKALDARTFSWFMPCLIWDDGRKVYLILDTLNVRTTTNVLAWVAAHLLEIALF